jgi:ABC-type branched-subunit amino acid transport system substrate-binding protein
MSQRFTFRSGWVAKIGAKWGRRSGLALLPLMLAPLMAASNPEVPQPRPRATGAMETEPSEIVLGQSAPFSGPSAQLGRDYRDGAMAWFNEVNRRGGIHGRRLRLVSLDDRYEPSLTDQNPRQLINGDRALVLFGYVAPQR